MRKPNMTNVAFESMLNKAAIALANRVREDGLDISDVTDYANEFAYGFENFNVNTAEATYYTLKFYDFIGECHDDLYVDAIELFSDVSYDEDVTVMDRIAFVCKFAMFYILEQRAITLFEE